MLNTSYNKSVYVALLGTLITLVNVFGPRFGFTLAPAEASALTAFGGVLINLFVPNKEVS